MAPDINTVNDDPLATHATDGYADNGVSRADYTIPDIVLHGPYTRKIKVLSIGAGVTGIMNAYHIQKYLKNVEHVIYEKNADIGGTWLENRYPGAACDIPSHAYTFPFALNPDWPRFFSYSPDIWKYLDKVCSVWDLRKYMNFNTEVIGAYWQEDTGEWLIKLKDTTGGQTRLFDERCHILLHGTGILNNFKWPNIEGMETFKGKIVHTARWPTDYQSEQWKSDRVAVIGSGASSIQTVPTMQPHAQHLDVFVRTPVWFVQIANNFGANHAYTDDQRQSYRDPHQIVEHAKSIEDQVNGLWGTFFKNASAQKEGQKALKARMAEFLKDERLLEGFTPSWGIGCRRVTPGDPYMEAIQKPNVDVHFTAVEKITPKGVVGADGVERECDTIVCATGFDVSYRPRFPIVGQNGVQLADKWKECPEGYMGLGIPDFPNFLTFIGPNWPVENGSVMGPLMYVSYYALQMIRKLQTEYVKSATPKQDITDEFNAHCQEWVRHTVWTEECRSWYKNNETGRVNAVWPGSSLHYIEAIRNVRWEDYDLKYCEEGKKNRFAYLGMGTTEALVKKEDPSPYLNVDMIDPDWMRAVGMDEGKIKEAKVKELEGKIEEIKKKGWDNVEKASIA
ncbi:putative sterigmatocystin biosynthesis monooxygenase stcW [Cyphellophora attinorum]|uniref:Putative sterigmatocystin biosynthesis monooxygenase stcW n=1 Tax=Cyphellophora attinorum TaxID=1664694 RepID=A0A0N1HQC6_9EURO|nr:putative sterigmatocystin biosynthesis monooxygenase stcW [Phialophora attinorum]KPI37674.1 putative sterigmatocystin biosynthesis monooxygenase stcW [Phialophora attinorum]